MATNDLNNGSLTGSTTGETVTLNAADGDVLVMPNGLNPATADYEADGPDLVLTWDDGSEVVIEDFFSVSPQPSLQSEQGAEVSADLAAHLAGSPTAGMVAQAGSEGVSEQPIGTVDKAEGTVTVIRADGTRVELQPGDLVYQGDILETGDDGAIGVILADETTFSMAEDGRMVLDEMVYDPGTQEGSVSMSVMQGVFTFVSGQVAKTDPDAMTLNTPVATIGIRGTQVGLNISDGQNLDVVLMEEADGFVGEVVVMNNMGVTVLNGANEFTAVNSLFAAPAESIVIDSQQMIEMFSSTLRHLPLRHDNVNDFGLQGDTAQGDSDDEDFNDFETAAGGDDNNNEEGLADFDTSDNGNFNDFETAAGGEGEDIDAGGLADFDVVGDDALDEFETAAGGELTNQSIDDEDSILVAVDGAANGMVDIEILSGGGSGSGTSDPDPDPTPDPEPRTEPEPDVATEPVVSVSANGLEDNSFALNISVSAPGDGDTISSIVVSGVPSDASLSKGTQNADGTWTLTEGQLSGLTMKAADDFAGEFTLTVKATAVDGTASASSSSSGTVLVKPDADAPTLSAAFDTEKEYGIGEDVPLNITTAETDTDGSEVLSITIADVPEGAKLSAGKDNEDGTWTLSESDLSGLTIKLPDSVAGETVNLKVSSTSTDTFGEYSDSETVSQTVSIDVAAAPEVGAPEIIVNDVVSVEDDGSFALDITVNTTDGGDSIDHITLTNIPGEVTLSAGEKNDDGSWTLSVDDLAGLTATPDADYSGTFDVGVSAQASDGSLVASNTDSFNMLVKPDADAPTLETAAAAGNEDSAIALSINTAETDTDGSEVLSIVISGVPEGASLSAGTQNFEADGVTPDGTWTLTEAQLSGLELNPPANFSGSITLGVTSTSTDTLGEYSDSADTTGSIVVTVNEQPDAPIITVGNASGTEDTAMGLTISVAEANGVAVESVTLTGVPAGTVITGANGLSITSDGSDIELSAAQVNGDLHLTAPLDFSGDFNIGVDAKAVDGSEATPATVAVHVSPDADMPTLSAAAATGDEDTAIGLSITTAETDTDGSEVLSIRIEGVPEGAKLSAGTDNEDGTWTLTPEQLVGLELTPPANFSGSIELDVYSTSTDTLGNETDSETADTTLVVTVNEQPDAPIITVGNASGTEDTAMGLTISVAEANGVAVESVTLTGVPAGTVITGANGLSITSDGSDIELSAAQVNGDLHLTAPLDFSGDFNIGVDAKAVDGSEATPATVAVHVSPDADMPTLSAAAATGDEDTAIGLSITTAETDTDGSEVLSIRIEGVPEGAKLSAGTDNEDGTWTLTPEQLVGLELTPPANFSGSIELDVYSTSTDTLGNETDSETADTTLVVTVNEQPDAPIITVGNASGTEDTAMGLTISVAEANGVAVESVTLTGVPAGTVISGANGLSITSDGSDIELSAAQVNGDLQLTAPLDFSGDFNIGVDAKAVDGSEATPATVAVHVSPDADMPTLSAAASTGDEDTAIGLSITTAETDTDGSEVLSIRIEGVPEGAKLSAGTDNEDGTWTLTPEQLVGLELTPPANFSGSIELDVYSTSTDTLGNETDSETADTTLVVTVNEQPDAPIITVGNASGTEDTAMGLTISVAEANGVAVESVTLTGVPAGTVITGANGLSITSDGSDIELSAAQVNGDLHLTAPLDFSGDFNIGVDAKAVDGSEATPATVAVHVSPDADMPTLSAAAATGDEDTAIGLSITTAETDTDGSEVLSIRIEGVPEGAKLSAGTDNEDGTWTLTPEQLVGLELTPPANFSGSIELDVYSTSTDTLGNETDSETADTTLVVTVNEQPDAPIITVGNASGTEDTAMGLTISVAEANGVAVESVTLTGVPAGTVISGANGLSITSDGSDIELSAAQVNGDLQLTAPLDFSGDFNIGVDAKAVDGSEATPATVAVHVSPDADMPTLSAAASTGDEDTAIGLSITTAETDTDGSEVLSIRIEGVPEGAKLSAGTDNEDGTWTLTPEQLVGLELTPPANFSGSIELDVYSTSTDTLGNETDSETADTTLVVTVNEQPDAPIITVGNASGTEDTAMGLTISVAEANGVAVESVTLTGVPAGTVITGANGLSITSDGSDIELSAAQVNGDLHLTAPLDFSGDFNIGVDAKAVDGSEATPATVAVHVSPDADMPTLSAAAATGDEDTAIGLSITTAETDTDGSEVLSIRIEGVPEGAKLSAGTDNEDGTWTLTPEQLVGLELTPPANFSGSIELDVYSTSTDTLGNETDSETADTTLVVTVNEQPDAPIITVGNASGTEDTAMGLTISVAEANGVAVDSVTLTGVPAGTVISGANGLSITSDGSDIELSAAQVNGDLQLTAPLDFSGDFNIGVDAKAVDGSEATPATVAVHVSPDADMPTLSAAASTGDEDTAIGLSITTAETDTDGSEVLSIRIEGVPEGAKLSAGTDNEDGTWTLTPEQLVGLELTPPANFSGSIELDVYSTSTDTLGNETDSETADTTLVVTVNEQPDAPIITVGNASGTEDTAMGLTISVAEANGVAVESVTLTGVPAGTVITGANGLSITSDGSDIELSAAQVNGDLQLTAPLDFSGDFNIGVDAKAVDGSEATPATVAVHVSPDADMPTLSAAASTGDEDTAIGLSITTAETDTDGSEVLSIRIEGVPEGAKLSAGTDNEDGTWTLTPEQLVGLELTPPANFSGSIELDVYSTSTDTLGNETDSETADTTLVVTVNEQPDAPIITVGNASGTEDTAMGLTISVAEANGVAVESVTLTGVPAGTVITGANGLSITSDGSDIELSAAQVNGDLQLTAPLDFSGDFNIGVDAKAVDGSEATPATVAVHVSPDADMPTLSAAAATGDEDTAIGLSITTAETDTDGSEVLSIRIEGVPEGAKLSAGTDNEDGTWTLTPEQLVGLELTPPANFSGSIELDVYSTSTDTLGNETDSETADTTLVVTVNEQPDAPIITVGNASGTEDTAMGLTISVAEANGVAVESVTLTGVPAGTVITGANGLSITSDGSDIELSAAQVNGDLHLTAPLDFSGDFNIGVDAKAVDGSEATPATVAVHVSPDADMPTLSAAAATGDEDTAIGLSITTAETDTDGSEVLSIRIEGVPEGAKLSAGTDNEDGTWTLTPEQLVGLELTPPANFSGSIELDVYSTSTDTLGNETDSETADTTLVVTVNEQPDAPIITVGNASGTEDTAMGLTISVAEANGVAVESVTLTGVPAGTVITGANGLSITSDGSDIELSAAQVNGDLQLTAPLDFSGDFNIGVDAKAVDGSEATPATVAVHVSPDADMPTLSAAAATGDEDTAIGLSITTAETDTDGSEVLSIRIEGVPEGAKLSAGTDNEDGTWTLTPEQLVGLELTPPANFSGSIELDVYSTSTDTLGNETDSETADTTLVVTVNEQPDAPIITVGNASGTEDTAMGLTISVAEANGVAVESVTLTGVPAGTVITGANGLSITSDGSDIELSAAQVNGDLHLTAPLDFSGDFNIGVDAKAVDGSEATPATVAVHVSPDADMPTLSAAAATGDEDTAIGLSITTAETDTDGSEVLSIRIEGVPEGAKLSAGTDNEDGTWTLTPEQLVGLELTPPANFSGSIELDVYSTSTDTLGNETDSETADTTLVVTVNEQPDAPIITVGNASGTEDTAMGLTISVAEANGVAVDSVTLTGVPAGTVISGANGLSITSDGSDIELSAAQVNGDLHLTAPLDFSGDFNIGVDAKAVDGSEATPATVAVHVSPDADMPTLSAAAATGDEDTAIGLSITTAETDTDGSEVLSIRIEGVPEGAKLSAGTDNEDGTWTLTPEQLVGLELTPPANFSGSIELDVYSTSTDTLGNETDSETADTTLVVTVNEQPDAPIITVGNASGTEDTAMGLTISVAEANGVAVESVTLTGVPAGTVITGANGLSITSDGSDIELSAAQVNGDLQLTAPLDFSGDFNIGVDAKAVDGSEATPATVAVHVSPDADMPTLSAAASTGDEDTAIGLSITTAETDTDGSEVLSIRIEGVPEGAKLSAGTDNEDGTWTLTPEQLSGLELTPPANFSGSIELDVYSTSTDTLGNETDSETADTTLVVTVNEQPDAPIITVGNASGTEDTAMGLTISVAEANGVAVDSVTLTGVPAGTVITGANGLSITSDGSDIELSAAQVNGDLHLTAPLDFSGDFNIGVDAKAVDGSEATPATVAVHVSPDADMPTLSAAASTGDEDTAIGLSITTAETDTDGSEVLSIRIEGVPEGAKLSAGTDNEDGTWTLTPEQLVGLELTPPANFSGSIELDVYSTSTDTLGNETDSETAMTSLTVTVEETPDNPDIIHEDAAGDEDTAIALDISAEGTGGVPVESVTISGIPDGARLSIGMDNTNSVQAADGTWTVTLSPDELDGLTITPPLNYSGDFDLDVTATAEDGSTTSATTNVAVEAVADAPTLTLDIGEGTPTEGGFIPDIDAFPHDLSNIVMYLQNDDGSIDKIKIEDFPGNGLDDVNDLGLQEFIETNYPGTDLVGLTVKAGDNHTPGFGPGEGELVYIGDGMTQADLPVAAHADEEFSYGDTLQGLAPTPVGGGSDGGMTYPVEITTNLTDTDGSEVLSVQLTNVPDGVEFSAGTDNGNGTWDIPVNALDGLTMEVPAGTEAFTLGAISTSTEQSNQDAASTTAQADVGEVVENPDPSVDTVDATGNEDGSVALDITVSNADTITITNVSNGDLSAGIDNGDGSWTLTPAQLEGLTFTPDGDWSGSFDIGVTAQAEDGTSVSDVSSISVTPDADAPTLSAEAASGAEDAAIDLNISTGVTDTDGSESISSVVISGVPAGAELSAGTDNGNGTWTFDDPADLNGLTITPADNYNGTFNLSVTTNVTDTATGLPSDTSSANTSVTVTVVPVGDEPGISIVGSGSGDEDTQIPVGITVTPVGDEEVTSVTITGVPDNASLSLGTDNGGGSWTISGDDLDSLSSLTMTPELHYSGTPTFSITATTDEGGSVSVDAPVNVNAVADTPNLTLDIGEGTAVEATGSVSLENMGQESAAYENTLGWYVKGENGEPTEGGIIWADTKQDIGDVWTMDGVDPDTIGFFVLPNGGSANPDLANGDTVSFQQDGNGTWQVVGSDGNTLDAASSGDVALFHDPALNANNFDYTADNGVGGNMNWEDLLGGGDNDFNDVNVNLTTEAGSGVATTEYPVDITTSLVDTDGSETLTLVVSGVPDGAIMSAGMDQGGGTWAIPTDALNGLTITVPDSIGDDFVLSATATATEPNGDTASVTVSDTVDVPEPAADPTVTINGVPSGNEDTVIALDISVTNADSVTISGLPADAVLSAGANNGGGSWTFDDPADLNGLTMTPGEHYSGLSSVTVTATNVDGVTAEATGSVEVVAVADAPNLTVSIGDAQEGSEGAGAGETLAAEDFSSGVSGWGNQVSSYNGQMNIDHNDTGSKTFDFGAENAGQTVTISFDVSNYGGWDTSGSAADYFSVTGNGTELLNTTQASGSHEITATLDENGQLQLELAVDATYCQEGVLFDNLTITSGDDWGSSDTTVYDLDISSSLVDTDGSETLSLTVGGLPDGATLSAGTDNEDGTWTLSANDLDGLQVEVTDGVSADFDLTVTATATEPNGDTASVSSTVTVDVEDAPLPTVSMDDAVSGNEDTAIPLNIAAANAATVTIAGVPSGATLSAGSDNGDGSWTVQAADVDGLTLTGDQDYSGSFNLTVTATSASGETASTTTSVEVVGVADAPSLSTAIGNAVITEDDGDGQNNGFGNGDQDAPGGSDDSNNAENADDGSSSFDVDDFGVGAGANAGSDEKENDLNKYDNEWTGDASNNDVDGEGGEDVLAGKGGADDIEGGSGDDLIFGGAGSDNLEGDSGNDIIFGGSGDNAIDGGSGNDFIIGGDGNDDIDGGKNDDVIFAGGGMNKVDGGSGTDVMVFTGPRDEYQITDMGNDQYVIEHLNGGADGSSWVEDIETFQFTDGQYSVDDMVASNPTSGDDDSDMTLTYDIAIDTGLTDTDGSETLSDVTISGLPDGASFSAGTDNGDGTWTMEEADLNGLTLDVQAPVSEDFTMTVSVTSTEANGDAATSSSTIDVTLPEEYTDAIAESGSDIVGDTSVDALDPLAAMFEDSDTLTFDGQEYDISSLTDGDTTDNYGGAAPIGKKAENEDYNPADNDTGDGYSSTDDGSGGSGPDIE